MQSIIIAAAGLLLFQACANARDDFEVRFVDDIGAPLIKASFFLYQIDEAGQFVADRFRDRSLGATASIKFYGVPARYTVGVITADGFYCRFWQSNETPLTPGLNVIRVNMSGSLSVLFSQVDPSIFFMIDDNREFRSKPSSPSIFCFRQDVNGDYKFATSVGLFPEAGTPYRIDGLEKGIYKCELIDPDNPEHVYWTLDKIEVNPGLVTQLNNLRAVKIRKSVE